jgi:hypothetical protein
MFAQSVTHRARHPGRGLRRVAAIVAAACAALAMGTPAGAMSRGPDLQIYYRSPVLVGAAEGVRIPVDVVCATAAGRACSATATVAAADPAGRWHSFTARARPGMIFDLSAPAARVASGPAGTGAVRFRVSARAADGRTASLPGGQGALRVYVAPRIHRAALGTIPFISRVHRTVVLRLPWGTGARSAGLSPGSEAATVGPSSFDVDARGRIFLLDPLQHRIAVFHGYRLVRQVPVSATPESDLAVGEDGAIHVASQAKGSISLVSLSAHGQTLERRRFARSILAELRTAGPRTFVHLLPLDAWVAASGGGRATRPGLPLRGGGFLLQSVVGRSVRLGIATRTDVRQPVEIDSRAPLGELALGAGDRRGGLWAVFRRFAPATGPDGRYVAVHVAPDGSIRQFAMPARTFADQRAFSQIRLGRDGHLYQLRTFPSGMRIVRYDIEEGS